MWIKTATDTVQYSSETEMERKWKEKQTPYKETRCTDVYIVLLCDLHISDYENKTVEVKL